MLLIPYYALERRKNVSLNSVEPPLNSVEPPLNSVEPPLNSVEPPLNSVEPPLNSVELPLNSVELPLNSVELPLNLVELPLNLVELPLNSVDASIKYFITMFCSLIEDFFYLITMFSMNNTNTLIIIISDSDLSAEIYGLAIIDWASIMRY